MAKYSDKKIFNEINKNPFTESSKDNQDNIMLLSHVINLLRDKEPITKFDIVSILSSFIIDRFDSVLVGKAPLTSKNVNFNKNDATSLAMLLNAFPVPDKKDSVPSEQIIIAKKIDAIELIDEFRTDCLNCKISEETCKNFEKYITANKNKLRPTMALEAQVLEFYDRDLTIAVNK